MKKVHLSAAQSEQHSRQQSGFTAGKLFVRIRKLGGAGLNSGDTVMQISTAMPTVRHHKEHQCSGIELRLAQNPVEAELKQGNLFGSVLARFENQN